MIYGVTGHRPLRLGLGYDKPDRDRLYRFFASIMDSFPAESPSAIISGFAQGWDATAATWAIVKKVPLIAAIPFKGQEKAWPAEAQLRYQKMLGYAKEVHYITDGGYSKEAFLLRDNWVVDRADAMIALYDGQGKSGTAHTVGYATSAGKLIINCWDAWRAEVDGISPAGELLG